MGEPTGRVSESWNTNIHNTLPMRRKHLDMKLHINAVIILQLYEHTPLYTRHNRVINYSYNLCVEAVELERLKYKKKNN